MIKLHAHIPRYEDGTSWYRGAGPLLELAKTHRDELSVRFFNAEDGIEWWNMADADLVFLQRPFSPRCATFFGIGQTFGAKAIADWDDNFGDIHPSNPVAATYQDPAVKACVVGIRKSIDVAWTTTEHLKGPLDADAGKPITRVIPNAWPLQYFPFANPGENNLIVWRGGSSHLGDLLEFAPGIQKFAAQFPLWQLTVIGDRTIGGAAWPFHYHWPKDRMQHQDWLTVPLYLRNFLITQPAIVIVPLQDTMFNRSKSNIAWLEGAAAGAVTVCPDWPEWRLPGTFRYVSKNDFAEKLKEAASTPRKKRAEMALEAQDYIRENLTLAKINELRMEDIRRLAVTTPVDKFIQENK